MRTKSELQGLRALGFRAGLRLEDLGFRTDDLRFKIKDLEFGI